MPVVRPSPLPPIVALLLNFQVLVGKFRTTGYAFCTQKAQTLFSPLGDELLFLYANFPFQVLAY